MRVVFFPIGTLIKGGGYKHRCISIAEHLEEYGIKTEIKIPLAPHPKDNKLKKSLFHFGNLIKRCIQVVNTQKGDIIFVQKGMADYGSPLPEFIAKKVLKRKMVFHFDDAIYLLNSKIRFEPWRTNVRIKWSDIVIVGSHSLYDYAKNFNDRVFLIPVSIDTRLFKFSKINKSKKKDKTVIGWIGSPGIIEQLELLKNPLRVLGENYKIELRLFGISEYKEKVPSFQNIELKIIEEWLDTKTLIEEISKLDISVVPLFDGEWERGKCSVKLLESMAVGTPCVCSAVGENNYIIDDGKNGFLALNEKEWIEKIKLLINNPKISGKIGSSGRKTIEETYSYLVNSEKLVNILTKKIKIENGERSNILEES